VNAENQVVIASRGDIPLLMALVRDGNDSQKVKSAAELAKIISEHQEQGENCGVRWYSYVGGVGK